MLVLTRKPGEKLCIGKNITVTVLEVHGNRVRLGFDAPKNVSITRSELTPFKQDDLGDPELWEKPVELCLEWELDVAQC